MSADSKVEYLSAVKGDQTITMPNKRSIENIHSLFDCREARFTRKVTGKASVCLFMEGLV